MTGDVLKAWLKCEFFDPNATEPKRGRTPLQLACGFSKNPKAVDALFEASSFRDINVNAVNVSGHTALHLASMHGHGDIVRKLLAWVGVDANARNNEGPTPVTIALMGNVIAITNALNSSKLCFSRPW